MNLLWKKILAGLTTVSFLSGECAAASLEAGLGARDALPRQPAAEYYLAHIPGELLIPVNLIGGVGRPGLYYVPKNTDVFRLIAAAGGIRPESEKEELIIKRRSGAQEQVITHDVADILRDTKTINLTLEPEDVVIVPFREPALGPDTMQVTGFIASVLSILVSAVLLQRSLE